MYYNACLWHILGVVMLAALINNSELRVAAKSTRFCFGGNSTSIQIHLEGVNGEEAFTQDAQHYGNVIICCDPVCQRVRSTDQINGAVFDYTYPLIIGDFSHVDSLFTGPIIDERNEAAMLIDWDPKYKSYAYSMTTTETSICIHGLFYLQRSHGEPIQTLLYHRNRLEVPDSNHAQLSNRTIASVFTTEGWITIEEQSIGGRREGDSVLRKLPININWNGTMMGMIDFDNEQMYYAFGEKPFKLKEASPDVCVLTTAQRMLCGRIDTKNHQWHFSRVIGGTSDSKRMTYISDYIRYVKGNRFVEVEAGSNLLSVRSSGCKHAVCSSNSRFTVDGDINFVKWNFDNKIFDQIMVEGFLEIGLVFGIAYGILLIIVVVLAFAKKQQLLGRTVPIVLLLMITCHTVMALADVITALMPYAQLLILFVQHINRDSSNRQREQLIEYAIYISILVMSVSITAEIQELHISSENSLMCLLWASYAESYGLTTFLDFTAALLVLLQIKIQPKTTRKWLLPIDAVILLIVVVNGIAIFSPFNNTCDYYSLDYALSFSRQPFLAAPIFEFLGWLLLLLLSKPAIKRMLIQSNLFGTFRVFAIARLIKAGASISFITVPLFMFYFDNQLLDIVLTRMEVFYRLMTGLSPLIILTMMSYQAVQFIRIKIAQRRIKRELMKLKEDRRKGMRITDKNTTAELRERLLDDLESTSRDIAAAASPIDQQESDVYFQNLDALNQLAERCFISMHQLRFLRRIAQGSFGVVYEALWQPTGSNVAVKILKNVNDDAKIEFLREAGIMSELRHPNIVMFLGVSLKEDSFCIISEFASNGCLQDVLLCGSLIPWNTKIRICIEIVKALGYLHGCTPIILHRDLKSRNILLDDNMTVKLCDFGLAKHEQGSTNTANIGTVHFMAPEIISGDQYSAKCDIYSFGIVMWEIFYQREPYDDMEANSDSVSGFVANKQFVLPMKVVQGLRPTEYSDQRQVKREERDGAQPNTANEIDPAVLEKYLHLMRKCWSAAPAERPELDWILDDLQKQFV